MPRSAPDPKAAVERLGAMSEVRSAVLLEGEGRLAACAGEGAEEPERLARLARELLHAADSAGSRAGVEPVAGVEISRPEGGVFGARPADGDGWALVATTAPGALPSLVLYDLGMTLRALGEPR